MNFQTFWQELRSGGETSQGDRYRVEGHRLHIQSRDNRNKKYYVSQKTVQRYFEKEIPEMSGLEFRRRFSVRFYRVYAHITGEPELA